MQETRLWDASAGETRRMRCKEDAHDYRYFPEPDLPPLRRRRRWSSEVRDGAARAAAGQAAARFQAQYGLPAYDAEILVADRALADFFEAVAAHYGRTAKKLANWFMGELLAAAQGGGDGALARSSFTPAQFAALLEAGRRGRASPTTPPRTSSRRCSAPARPAGRSSGRRGWPRSSDTGAVEAAVDAVLAANPGEVEKYRAGKKQVFGFFVGQVMKAMKGKGNPALVNAALKARLGE